MARSESANWGILVTVSDRRALPLDAISEIETQASLAAGCGPHAPKPYQAEILLKAVFQLLASARD